MMGACAINVKSNEQKQQAADDRIAKSSPFASAYPLSLTSHNMAGHKAFKAECHWLIRDLVLIGEYPLSSQYIDHLCDDQHINVFICMVGLKHEVPRYQGLTNYWDRWITNNKKYKNRKIELLESPIADFSVSDDQTMINFLTKIVNHIMDGWLHNANKTYYMHCMTGHGRTGLISVLLLMCLYRIEWPQALDLLKIYHRNRDCRNGKYFYNSCEYAMAIKAQKYDAKKYSLSRYYPMPQESSQYRQIERLQKVMHQIHDKYVANCVVKEKAILKK
eukprot:194128_1